jgi:hypothetical protein
MCYRQDMQAKLALLTLGLVPPGCLYVDGKNHAPSAAIELPAAKLRRCDPIMLRAQASDPDQDTLSYSWRVRVASTDDEGGEWDLVDPSGSSVCDSTRAGPALQRAADRPPVAGQSEFLSIPQLPLRGSYSVELEVRDGFRAARTVAATFVVENQPPVFELRLDRDPTATEDKVPDATGGFPAHAHYLVWVNGTDHENDLRCGGRSSVSWKLVAPDESSAEYVLPRPCVSGKQPELRVRLSPHKVSAGTTLRVQATVADGFGGSKTSVGELELAPNRPPCLEATQPPFDLPKVLVAHQEGRRFDVSLVNDDVPASVSFSWLVREEGAASWSKLGGLGGPVLDLPPWFRAPGKKLELRAIAEEADVPAARCAESEALCPPAGQAKTEAVPAGCYRWVTWKLEFI